MKQKCPDAPRVRGPFPILSTPFTTSGDVDFEVLARQARFLDWCESPGMIWPQSGDSVSYLTRDEKLEGMKVLAKTSRNLKTTALCLGVQGRDTDDMLVYARHADKLAPAAIISRPPDTGKTQDDLRQYWRALAAVTKRPVIIQTTGGTKFPPSIELLVELAEAFPNFGYVKEEARPHHSLARASCSLHHRSVASLALAALSAGSTSRGWAPKASSLSASPTLTSSLRSGS